MTKVFLSPCETVFQITFWFEKLCHIANYLFLHKSIILSSNSRVLVIFFDILSTFCPFEILSLRRFGIQRFVTQPSGIPLVLVRFIGFSLEFYLGFLHKLLRTLLQTFFCIFLIDFSWFNMYFFKDLMWLKNNAAVLTKFLKMCLNLITNSGLFRTKSSMGCYKISNHSQWILCEFQRTVMKISLGLL